MILSNNFSQKTLIQRGNSGEEYVADYLLANGYIIRARNYRVRAGEIDIIAERADVIAFIEVKTRSSDYFNTSQVITPQKQRKIIAAARHYIFEHKLHDCVLRFDSALLTIQNGSFSLTYIPNSFTDERSW